MNKKIAKTIQPKFGVFKKNIYDALDSGIEPPQAFRDRLLSENKNRDEADVRDLFKAYYWD